MAVAADRTAAVLLAAGLSSRHPGDKLLTELNGRPLVAHAAATLSAIPFLARIAVVPPDAPARIEAVEAHGFEIVVNPDPAAGQGRSLRAGVRAAAAHEPDAFLLALADMPFVTEPHLRALLDRLDPADPRALAFSRGADFRSPPAAFAREWLDVLAGAEGDRGARPVLRAAPESAAVAAPEGALADFDTAADFARAEGENRQ